MEEFIKQKTKEFEENRNKVIKVFLDFFGEEFVDIQDLDTVLAADSEIDYINLSKSTSKTNITIHFPKLTVTNENNSSIKIQDLYANVTLTHYGNLLGNFKLIRTTFPENQWGADYAHSHIKGISRTFTAPCLGKGPIKNTITRLISDIGNPILWQLFCFELSVFVKVESLNGGPYRKMSNVTDNFKKVEEIKNLHMQSTYTDPLLDIFIKHLVNTNILQFCFYNSSFHIGMTLKEIILKISGCFIDWINNEDIEIPNRPSLDTLLTRNILIKGDYIPSTDSIGKVLDLVSREVISEVLFKFKNKDIKFKIIPNNSENNNNILYILSPHSLGFIVYKIITILNLNYGKDNYIPIDTTKIIY